MIGSSFAAAGLRVVCRVSGRPRAGVGPTNAEVSRNSVRTREQARTASAGVFSHDAMQPLTQLRIASASKHRAGTMWIAEGVGTPSRANC